MAFHPTALPDFPWDALEPHRIRARAHPQGAIVLAIGTPVDPTPEIAQAALREAANAPGYPQNHGTLDLREAAVSWFERRGARNLEPSAVLPTIGSKEFIGGVAAWLGLGVGDIVVVPRLAYPTYEVGARFAGASVLATDDVAEWSGLEGVRLVWLNSPSNPTGRVLDTSTIADAIAAAREIGAVVVSDECYAEFPWVEPWLDQGVPSALDERACAGSHEGVIAVYSLSKRSNLAGYRAGFAAGDPALLSRILEVRRHLGMMVPTPVETAMVAALRDDSHVQAQRAVYRRRRETLIPAFQAAGFSIEGSDAGLYLWATRREPCWETVEWLAERGIVVAPGVFYGSDGERHIRISLTATDSQVEDAARRLLVPR